MKTYFKLLFLAICFIQSITSCETDPPEVDEVPPTYSFVIQGDGLNHRFTERDDPSSFELKLKFNTPYLISFAGFDEGGLTEGQVGLRTEEFVNFTLISDPFSDQWRVNTVSFLTRTIDWSSPLQNSVDRAAFSAEISFPFDIVEGEDYTIFQRITFFVRDTGGQEGIANSTFGSIEISIGTDHEVSEVVYF